MRQKVASREEIIIEACLRAVLEGPFIPERIFQTLLGVSPEEVREIFEAWPNVVDPDLTRIAVNNSINNLLGYPHRRSQLEWDVYIPVSKKALCEFFSEWRGSYRPDTGRGYFDALM